MNSYRRKEKKKKVHKRMRKEKKFSDCKKMHLVNFLNDAREFHEKVEKINVLIGVD